MTQPRLLSLPGFFWLILHLVVLATGCSDPQTLNPAPSGSESLEITGFVLKDTHGTLASEPAGPGGSVLVLVGESFDTAIQILSRTDVLDVANLDPTLSIDFEVEDPEVLTMEAETSESLARFTGIRSGETTFRLFIRTADQEHYASASIPVRVETPVAVTGYRLEFPNGELFWERANNAVFLDLSDRLSPLQVEFVDARRQTIPRHGLGRNALLEWTVESPTVLEAATGSSDPFEVELRPIAAGAAPIHLRLRRGEEVLFRIGRPCCGGL